MLYTTVEKAIYVRSAEWLFWAIYKINKKIFSLEYIFRNVAISLQL